jgi:transposase-like protein
MQGYIQFKDEAISLRRQGKTYTEIQELLGVKVPPSTLYTWFKQLQISHQESEHILLHGKERIRNGSVKASATRKLAKKNQLEIIRQENFYLKKALNDNYIAEISLVMLYLCEGSKSKGTSLCFGNSDPGIIRLFLQLFRRCYAIDEKKFRCTVQCRADQDTETLISFWSIITLIPKDQFYRSPIDKRTVGIPTKKVGL